MFNFKLYFLVFIININLIKSEISDKRYCVDEKCTVPISRAKALISYPSPDPKILSFGQNEDILIYSKSAGTKAGLWGASVNGKRGYIPKHMVREYKIINKATLLVDTEIGDNGKVTPKVPLERPSDGEIDAKSVEPDKVQDVYEIVDGTTIYLNPQEPITPSSIEDVVQPTAAPQIVKNDDDTNDKTETIENSDKQTDDKIETLIDDVLTTISNAFSGGDEEKNDNTDEIDIEDDGDEDNNDNEDEDEEIEEKNDSLSVENPNPNQHDDENEEKSIEESDKLKMTNFNAELHDSIKTNLNSIKQNDKIESLSSEIIENRNETIVEIQFDDNTEIIDDDGKNETRLETLKESIETINNVETIQEITTEINLPELEIQQSIIEPIIENTTPNPREDQIEQESQLIGFLDKKLEIKLVEPVITKQINDDFIEETVNISTEPEIDENFDNLPVDHKIDEKPDQNQDKREEIVEQTPGIFSNVLSYFDGNNDNNNKEEDLPVPITDEVFETTTQVSFDINEPIEEEKNPIDEFCTIDSCKNMENYRELIDNFEFDWSKLNANILIYLTTTALSVILLLIGYVVIDKNRREGPLVAKINQLEKEFLIILKENELLKDNSNNFDNNRDIIVINDELNEKTQKIEELSNIKSNLEEQIQLLEKELENSTEVGLELNRMLSEILNNQNCSDLLKDNIDNLQRQLIEQQTTINQVNETLAITNTENHELKLEIELNNKKILDLQSELDKMCLNLLKIEEEKDTQQNQLENDVIKYRQLYDDLNNQMKFKQNELNCQIESLENQLKQIEHNYELKQNEFELFKENLKLIDGDINLTKLCETTQIQAEFELLKVDNRRLNEKLLRLENDKNNYDKQIETLLEEVQCLQEKYDQTDKLRVETQTKLEVLSNYFKEKEAQLQKEISKHEALWAEKEGEATSTTERVKFMQEQLQNYKVQNESLKQEIIAQEVELKSQISVLEKKAHENWMNARQVERKLEDTKQETAQLRHRLTITERALHDEKIRLQSPIEQNGVESPLLYGREHLTKSPQLPPFLPPPPPPPGVPFMPPTGGLPGIPPPPPPFMPPPNLYPGDHRPPPLGRMSSPPPSRYSPSSRGYSPYRDHSSSPSDSEYGTTPRHHRRGYSPFNDDRRDYKRPIRSNCRNIKGGSSGLGHSNESLEKTNRQQSKV